MRGAWNVSHEAALRDDLWIANPQSPDNADFFRADFDITPEIPQIILYKAVAGTRRSIARQLMLQQVHVLADANAHIMIAVDPLARFSAGGTAAVAQSARPGWQDGGAGMKAAEALVRWGDPGGIVAPELVATADNANTRYFTPFGIQAALGSTTAIDFDGEAWVDGIGAVLVYVWMDDFATVPMQFAWQFDFYEERLPS